MSIQRQRHIPLNINDRRELDRWKRDYEDRTGDVGGWGRFLRVVTLAGLTALGVYPMTRAIKRAPTVWQINCTRCGGGFLVQAPSPLPWRLVQAKCPGCNTELVVDFAPVSSAVSGERQAGTEDTSPVAVCHICRQPVMAENSKVDPKGIKYLECEHCGRVPSIRS